MTAIRSSPDSSIDEATSSARTSLWAALGWDRPLAKLFLNNTYWYNPVLTHSTHVFIQPVTLASYYTQAKVLALK